MSPAERPTTVLVVDDDPAMRALLRDWLEREGCRVLEAPSGERLLAAAETAEVDVVILDQEMPGQGGLDVLPAFRRRRPRVPVILITAFGGAKMAEDALRLGASHYLEKPFPLRALLRAVREAAGAGEQPGAGTDREGEGRA